MDTQFVRDRITQLRLKKGVSEYQMSYHYWLFGHYHDNRAIDEKHILLWEQIVQVI